MVTKSRSGTSSSGRHVPEGWPTVIPRIVVHDATGLVGFLRRVFEATGEYRPGSPAVMKIGDSLVMVSDAGIRGFYRKVLPR